MIPRETAAHMALPLDPKSVAGKTPPPERHVPLVVVGLLALISAGPRRIPQGFAVAAGALSAIIFVIGVALTIRVS